MAQLLLIKNANTPQKEVDDIVGIFHTLHKFSADELKEFNTMLIMGYERDELIDYMKTFRPVTKRIYKNKVSGVWTDEPPERSIAWSNSDKWNELKNIPKFEMTIKNMSEVEKEVLSSPTATEMEKQNALEKMEWKFAIDSDNQIEIPELRE